VVDPENGACGAAGLALVDLLMSYPRAGGIGKIGRCYDSIDYVLNE
jgi:hypothetical protein